MRILLFYQYYHNPDCAATGRHYQFVKALGQQHEVHVISSDVWTHKRQTQQFPWTPPGVTVHSFPVAYSNSMSVRDRFSAYAGYAWGAFRRGLRVPKPDVIMGTSTPLSAAWAAAKVAQIRRVPWVFEVRDLWPDFPFQMGAVSNGWIRQKLYALEKRLYQSAAHVITLSPDMEAHVIGHGNAPSKVSTLLNGTDIDLNERVTLEDVHALRQKHALSDKKVILYAGTFGRANAIPTMIQAARSMASRTDLFFAFLGEGYHAADLQQAAKELPNLGVFPPAPRHEIFSWFQLASLSLVSFIDLPVLAANSPAKFFDSLIAGTPVLVTNPGWTKRFVDEHRCGWSVPSAEPECLVRGIEQAFEDSDAYATACQNGRRVAKQQFDRNRMAEELASILDKTLDHTNNPIPVH